MLKNIKLYENADFCSSKVTPLIIDFLKPQTTIHPSNIPFICFYMVLEKEVMTIILSIDVMEVIYF
jgi:hypothetical protein